ncbi:glycosyltransferase family 9 protein [Candidatus Woesearchaeota archaeon]|nr:glycosyltransferase family 9 protein [Candidatus Woesearchaeota archaeon]
MKPDTMRRIDRWIGVPICFIFSIFTSIQRLFGFRKIKKGFKPRKMLFLELSEMGSTILAYPAMKKAKQLFNAEIFFMIFKENDQSVKVLDIIPKKNIITIRSKSFFLLALDTLAALWKIRSLKIDTIVDLELFSRFTSILSYLSGAKAISGFYKYHMEGLYRGNFLTHKVQYNPHYHISRSFMSLVHALGADVRELPLLKQHIPSDMISAKVKSSAEQKSSMLKKLKNEHNHITSNSKIVLFNPNASELLPIRRWPIAYYQQLAKNILSLKDTFIVITGVASEKPDAQAICNHVQDDRCIDFTGKTNLRELVDLYNVSKVLITNDSGPAHFASLTDIEIFVFFGPETPKLYKPLSKNCHGLYADFACSPCVSAFNHRKTSCTNARCLKAIQVKGVFDQVKKGLAK